MHENQSILAIETSSAVGSVALFHNGAMREAHFSDTHRQAAELVPTIDALLNQANISYKHLTDLAITIGPGSFTGLRIGLAVAGAITFSHPQLKTHGFTTLEALAIPYAMEDQPVHCIISAGKGDYYHAYFANGGDWLRDTAPIDLCRPDHLDLNQPGAKIGNTEISAHKSDPQAAQIAKAVAHGFLPTRRALNPHYIRPPDAKLPQGSRL